MASSKIESYAKIIKPGKEPFDYALPWEEKVGRWAMSGGPVNRAAAAEKDTTVMLIQKLAPWVNIAYAPRVYVPAVRGNVRFGTPIKATSIFKEPKSPTDVWQPVPALYVPFSDGYGAIAFSLQCDPDLLTFYIFKCIWLAIEDRSNPEWLEAVSEALDADSRPFMDGMRRTPPDNRAGSFAGYAFAVSSGLPYPMGIEDPSEAELGYEDAYAGRLGTSWADLFPPEEAAY
ncbi:hypothetical protein BB934_45520 (plasmid) [Microvirga ossetica]|uniref:Uncharacterized protein n=1 Tax=Microvirga ossetica TaxID=1882682 RepID=A0A1B2EZX4_9HYPH|nr:hypothetical protein [Microvirga ossetica]ANY85482.1 hypothetical protein BB934_45520 [Microvirga ossetica]